MYHHLCTITVCSVTSINVYVESDVSNSTKPYNLNNNCHYDGFYTSASVILVASCYTEQSLSQHALYPRPLV